MNHPVIRRIRGFGPAVFGLALLGCTNLLRAEDPPEVPDASLTPYETALLNYKNGHEEAALAAIDAAEKANSGDPATKILKARILTELRDFTGARTELESLNGNPGLTPALDQARTLAFGDLCLRQRSFDEATKFYESLLSAKPDDPDLMLKVIYARIGATDLMTAAKMASQLKPLDPDHSSYYFAKAALAQATGKTEDADEDIETARTLYGITATNRYLKTYLELFSSEKTPAAGTPAPSAATNAAPASP